MDMSGNITELTKALLVFHKEAGKISKDAKNPFFKSNYATLGHILDEISEPMQKAGLVITQFPNGDGLTTMLIHCESGQFLQATYLMPVSKENDPQAVGSSITYARRYAVAAVLSLKIEDDDGNAGAGKYEKKQPATKPTDNRPWLNKGTEQWNNCVVALRGSFTITDIEKKYKISKENKTSLMEEAAQ